MDEVRLTCSVPEAARLLGIGRDAAYAAAARGEIPTLRLGRRLVVPLAQLESLLGGRSRPGHSEGPAAAAPDPNGEASGSFDARGQEA